MFSKAVKISDFQISDFWIFEFRFSISDFRIAKILLLFFSQIKNADLSKRFLGSYDVTSYFTNVLLQETIEIAINLIFNHNPNLNITRKELKKIFFFATSQTYFIFNSKFHNQIDGIAMVSP